MTDEKIIQAIHAAHATGQVALTFIDQNGEEKPTNVLKTFLRELQAADDQHAAQPQECLSCNGLGDFHDATGEYRGECRPCNGTGTAPVAAQPQDYGLGGLLMLVVRRPGLPPFLKRPYGDTAEYVREIFSHNPDAEITIVRSWADDVGCQAVEDGREFLAMEAAIYEDAEPAAPVAAQPQDDAAFDQTIKERDHYHEIADKLAEAIAAHFEIEIGEHSNMNCPWTNALEFIESKSPKAQPQEKTYTRDEVQQWRDDVAHAAADMVDHALQSGGDWSWLVNGIRRLAKNPTAQPQEAGSAGDVAMSEFKHWLNANRDARVSEVFHDVMAHVEKLERQLAKRDAQPAPAVPNRLTVKNAPVGTKAPAIGGGHWYRTERGWKWNGPDGSGGTFPNIGGDWNGKLIPPAAAPSPSSQNGESQ